MLKKNIIICLLKKNERKAVLNKNSQAFEASSIADLAFLLLIFFIVTASFIMRQGIFFSLPSNESGSIKIKDDYILNITPQRKGYIYKKKLVSQKKMTSILVQHRKQSKRSILIISMPKKVKYERLIDTLSLARENFIKEVSLKNI